MSEAACFCLEGDVIAVALGFLAGVALFLLLMGWLEGVLFPGLRALTEPVHGPDSTAEPVPLEDRP